MGMRMEYEIKENPPKRQEVRDLINSLRGQPQKMEDIEAMINIGIDLAIIETLEIVSGMLKEANDV